jgi:hypothetical protein
MIMPEQSDHAGTTSSHQNPVISKKPRIHALTTLRRHFKTKQTLRNTGNTSTHSHVTTSELRRHTPEPRNHSESA